ncbi:MAG: flagellar basal body P-ring protein FlgI [Desulfobacterales bacterium]|jgi:flagellar P-ring protein precursor FlgI|nr:flagellar basal body P-ring protein FlgI [Desulfobacterales bacterium]
MMYRKGKSMKRIFMIIGMIVGVVGFLAQPVMAARIKELAAIKGIRTNQLVGYGLVVGLDGTGDKSGTEFTIQSLVSMMAQMGVRVSANDVKVKNVAAVMVTAKMLPFSRIGNRIDVMVSSVGDAKSLVGGTLLLTPLKAVDGQVYALAQGPVSVGGIGAAGAGGSVTKNHLLVARVADGGSIEREVPVQLNGKESLTMTLFNPDFTTALRVADRINIALGTRVAHAIDSGTLTLNVPETQRDDVAGFLARVETLDVEPDVVAKIIVNEKTGTVVVGENVRISTVAISHGNLSITVRESADVSQPEAFGRGSTVVTPVTDIEIKEEGNKLMLIESGTTIRELVQALNAVGVTPRDLISIFQSIKAAGALQAELEII